MNLFPYVLELSPAGRSNSEVPNASRFLQRAWIVMNALVMIAAARLLCSTKRRGLTVKGSPPKVKILFEVRYLPSGSQIERMLQR